MPTVQILGIGGKYVYLVPLTHTYIYCSIGWAVEYTDCPSGEGQDTPLNECSGYNTKQSEGEVPVILELCGMQSTPFIAIAPRSTLARSGSTW